MSEKQTFCYSFDEQTFTGDFGSRAEALEEVSGERESGTVVWTGVSVLPHARKFMMDVDTLCEHMGERAVDEAGEFAEDWLLSSFSPEVNERIAALLEQVAEIIQQAAPPTFFSVSETVQHTIAATDGQG